MKLIIIANKIDGESVQYTGAILRSPIWYDIAYSTTETETEKSEFVYIYIYIQALTTSRIFRLPIRQPAGKNQVAPIKIQVAPFCRAP